MSFVLGNRDGEERIVEDVLEGENVIVDDEGRNAASVDRFKSSRCPRMAKNQNCAA